MDGAVRKGRLIVTKYLHENRVDVATVAIDKSACFVCTTEAMNRASEHGRLEIVKFLHKNRKEGCTAIAMDAASGNGHFQVLKFLHDRDVKQKY
jgi:hypothetical protein